MPSPILQYNRPLRFGGNSELIAFSEYGISLGETPLSNNILAALNRFITELKRENLWNSIQVLYPFVGGTTGWHSLNLKDPTLFRMTQNGTVVNDTNGTQGNGINGYWNTGFDISAVFNTADGFFSLYSRTNTQDNGFFDCGQTAQSGGQFGLQANDEIGNIVSYWGGVIFGSNQDSLGFFTVGSVGEGTFVSKNGIVLGSDFGGTQFSDGTTMYLMGQNNGGILTGPSLRQYSFFAIGNAVVDDFKMNVAVQKLQAALGRQV